VKHPLIRAFGLIQGAALLLEPWIVALVAAAWAQSALTGWSDLVRFAVAGGAGVVGHKLGEWTRSFTIGWKITSRARALGVRLTLDQHLEAVAQLDPVVIRAVAAEERRRAALDPLSRSMEDAQAYLEESERRSIALFGERGPPRG
jgi:hypothetical protein